MSFEQRISELNETLQEAGESYMEKLAEIQTLQNRLSNQVRTQMKPTVWPCAHYESFLFVNRSKKWSVYKVTLWPKRRR